MTTTPDKCVHPLLHQFLALMRDYGPGAFIFPMQQPYSQPVTGRCAYCHKSQ